MSPLLSLVLPLFLVHLAFTFHRELQLERFNHAYGYDLVNASGMRVRNFNRTARILEGDAELFKDLGNDHKFTIRLAHSRLGNNQWNDYPYKIVKDHVCNILNGVYKEYMPYFIDYTNYPRVGDEWLCPFPKGHYWARDFLPEVGWVPLFLPAGYWRLSAEMYDPDDQLAIQLELYFRYTKEGIIG